MFARSLWFGCLINAPSPTVDLLCKILEPLDQSGPPDLDVDQAVSSPLNALEPFLKALIQILIHAETSIEWHSPSGISTTVSGVDGAMGVVDFSGDCGEARVSGRPLHIASDKGLQPQDQVSVNGSTDLSACLVGNDHARVFGIHMKTQGGGRTDDDVIHVDARGPEGFGRGSMSLAFTDEPGDPYGLSIYSSSGSTHTLNSYSNKPAIKRMFWPNTRFSV